MGTGETFVPFSSLHLLALAICALPILALTLAGRRLRPHAAETTLRRSWAIFALAYWFADAIWRNRNGLDLFGGLPLHVCDLNGLIAPLALLTQHRWARATLYFWTFTLSLQAFIQPMLSSGPAHLEFWTFWAGHTVLMGSAVYDVAVLGFRPRWGDLRIVLVVSLAYVAVVMPIDLLLGANYGFIGNPPPEKSIPPFIEALGPWPKHALIVMGLAVIGFVLVLLPWRLARAPAALNGDQGAVQEPSQ